MTDEQEVRAKALECGHRVAELCANAVGGTLPEKRYWEIISAFEVYIRDGVQPNGEKAT